MDLNISFQHKRFLKLRDFIRDAGAQWCFDIFTLENEWAFPIMRDFPYEPVNGSAIPKKGITWDYNKLSNKEWALEILEANPDLIDWKEISRQPWAKHLIEANMDKVYKPYLFANPAMRQYIVDHLDGADWNYLSLNPSCIDILRDNLDKVNWNNLSANKAAIPLLKANPGKINWRMLCSNKAALSLIEANIDKVHWSTLSLNEWSLHLLEEHFDAPDIEWEYIASKPWAISLLKKNLFQITKGNHNIHQFTDNPAAGPTIRKHRNMFKSILWCLENFCGEFIDELEEKMHKDPTSIESCICFNPRAMHLLEEFGCGDCNKHTWGALPGERHYSFFTEGGNPSIITYDYELIKQTNAWMKEGIIQYLHRPDKIQAWLEANPDLHIEDYNPLE